MHHDTLSARRIASPVDNSFTSIVIFGASGRMGARIGALALLDPAFDLRGCVVRDGSSRVGESIALPEGAPQSRAVDATTLPGGAHPAREGAAELHLETAKNIGKTAISAHAVIDFSSDAGVPESIALAERLSAALLVGTTALSARSLDALKGASRSRAVLVAPNTSLGVAVLSVLVTQACKHLGPDYHCSIVEAHHAAKKDAPSGTALRLASAARQAGHALRDDQILSMRGGDVIGEHTIRFAGPGECIELMHRATSRDLFARGALHAAAWLKGKPAGWYTMQDVLALPG